VSNEEVATLTLLVTAANLQVNIDILEVSRLILSSNNAHQGVLEQILQELKKLNERNI